MHKLFLPICGLILLGTVRGVADAPTIETSPLGVRVVVMPRWREPLQHPTYPPPSTYRVTAIVMVAGTNKVFAAPQLEIAPGESKSAEKSFDGVRVKLTANIESTRERVVVRVVGYRASALLFENQTDVWLADPPSPKR